MVYTIQQGREPTVSSIMTFIQESTEYAGFFTLTIEKGKTVEVNTRNNQVTVYIQQNGSRSLSYGKTFKSLAEAAESYKRQDIKTALYALAEA